MGKRSLIESIAEYARVNNSIEFPKNDDELDLFNKVMDLDNIADYIPLSIPALLSIANEVENESKRIAVESYIDLARKLGIECIGLEEYVDFQGDIDVIEGGGRGNQDFEEPHLNNDSKAQGEVTDSKSEVFNTREHRKEPCEEYRWNIPDLEYKADFHECVFGYVLSECVQKLELKNALLLMGVPGTGKTTIMKNLIDNLTEGDEARFKIVSFGQSTDYSDFIGGLVCINGRWEYRDGVLTEICKAADADRGNKYYLGIDELSRGNTEAIFGELMTGIEHRDTIITLKNGKTLVIPSNLYIIGTMNTLDNSTKRLDTATMERFTQYYIEPQWNNGYIDWLLKNNSRGKNKERVRSLLYNVGEHMHKINGIIKEDRLLGTDKVIGTRAISGIDLTLDNVRLAIENQLIPEVERRMRECGNKEDLRHYLSEIESTVKGMVEDK